MAKKKKTQQEPQGPGVFRAVVPLSEMPEGLRNLMFPDQVAQAAPSTADLEKQAQYVEGRRSQAMHFALMVLHDHEGPALAAQSSEGRLSMLLKAADRIARYLETGDTKEPIPEHFLAD